MTSASATKTKINSGSGSDGDVETSSPQARLVVSSEESRRALLGKPNRNSVRNMNSLVRSEMGRPRSRHNIDLSAINDGEEDGVIEESNADDFSPEKKKSCCTGFCGFMDDHFLAFVIASSIIGLAIGIGLAYWNPDNYADKATAILWIGLLGDLFIRALKCIILPLVFVSITVSVMDMVSSCS